MKKPPNAYILYVRSMYKDTMTKHPTLSFSERSKLISQQWRSLTPDKKNVYYDKAYTLQQEYIEYVESQSQQQSI